MILVQLFSRKWWKTTLLVVLAMGGMVRLGVWQLDRLAQRRAFNARVHTQIEQPPLKLARTTLEADLPSMEYRQVVVTGEYDFTYEVALRNQAWSNQIGVHLITPLIIAGSDQAVLVNRGWIPYQDFASGNWGEYAEPGIVEVRGVIRRSQEKPDIGWRRDPTPAPGEGPLKAWNILNVQRIAQQVPLPLLPVYIQQAPDPTWTSLPYRDQPKLELTEGPHLGYAIQWFSFALLLAVGFPIYVHRMNGNADYTDARRFAQI